MWFTKYLYVSFFCKTWWTFRYMHYNKTDNVNELKEGLLYIIYRISVEVGSDVCDLAFIVCVHQPAYNFSVQAVYGRDAGWNYVYVFYAAIKPHWH